MRETKTAKAQRIQKILEALAETYPDAAPQLMFSTPFELLVATVLSAQCTDQRVNQVTKELFPIYGTPEKMAVATEEELIPYIKSCGLYQNKSKNLAALARILVKEYGGQVPKDREALMELPGVGRKTANVVISNAFGTPAIAVDTHVFRVANRTGLAEAKDVWNTERQLMQAIPEEKWSVAHHWLIFHGRRVCTARSPKCEICTVSQYCKKRMSEEQK